MALLVTWFFGPLLAAEEQTPRYPQGWKRQTAPPKTGAANEGLTRASVRYRRGRGL